MNELLEKYWEGTTSIEEELQLKRYFASANIDAAHEVYKPIFSAFALEKEVGVPFNAFANLPAGGVEADAKIPVLNQEHNPRWKSLAMAASFVAVFTLGVVYQEYSMPKKDLGTYKTPEEAYDATLGALQFMGTKINDNKSNLQPMQTLQIKKKALINGDALRNTVDSLENDINNNNNK